MLTASTFVSDGISKDHKELMMKAAYGYKNDDELAKSGSRASKRSLKRNGSRSSARSSHSVGTPIVSRKQGLGSRKNLKVESNQKV